MNKIIEEIFSATFDQQDILSNININLLPVLQGRKGTGDGEEFFRKLSFCLGYHIRKVEILRSIVLTYFRHNTIKRFMDRNEITANVDGIISAESDMNELMGIARAFYEKALFNSHDQRDASYIMSCMKFIIEASLLVNFIGHLSNREHTSFLPYSYDKLVDIFNKTLEKYAAMSLREVMKSM